MRASHTFILLFLKTFILFILFVYFVKNWKGDNLSLTFGGGFGLFKLLFGLGGEIQYLTAVIISAFHADGVAFMLCAAVAAF